MILDLQRVLLVYKAAFYLQQHQQEPVVDVQDPSLPLQALGSHNLESHSPQSCITILCVFQVSPDSITDAM